MELDRFLNLIAASIGALGSIYVLRSYLLMTPAATASLAQSGWGFTLPIIDSLSAQRAESIVGTVAFLLALVLGIASIAFVEPGVVAFGSRACALMAAVIVVAAVTLCLHL